MTRECAIRMLKAKLKCMELEISGTTPTCNNRDCDVCRLNYEQGNMGEQKECLRLAIKALESDIAMDFITLCDKLSHENEEQQQTIDELQTVLKFRTNENKELYKEINRLKEVIKIKDDERIELVEENKELQRKFDDTTNDYKMASYEISVLNKYIDKLTIENNELKCRLKILNKAFLNSIYGITGTIYADTDSIKETKNNDSNN